MLTPDELRALMARHRSDEADGEADAADTHEDRGALLVLLREVADTLLLRVDDDCIICGLDRDEDGEQPHSTKKPVCIVPLLEVLRQAEQDPGE